MTLGVRLNWDRQLSGTVARQIPFDDDDNDDGDGRRYEDINYNVKDYNADDDNCEGDDDDEGRDLMMTALVIRLYVCKIRNLPWMTEKTTKYYVSAVVFKTYL